MIYGGDHADGHHSDRDGQGTNDHNHSGDHSDDGDDDDKDYAMHEAGICIHKDYKTYA